MALSFNREGRELFSQLSEEGQARLAGIITRYNSFRPEPKDERSAWEKTKAVGSAVKKQAWDFAKNLDKETQRDGVMKTGGNVLWGAAKGIPRLGGQIYQGAKNMDGIFGKWETDPEEFIEKMKFKHGQDKVNRAIPITGAAQKLGSFIGEEVALTLATAGLGQATKLKYAPRIARFAAGTAIEGGTELLRTGNATAAGIAGVAGGIGMAIPKRASRLMNGAVPDSAIVKKAAEDPIKTWFKGVGLTGRKHLESYGDWGKAAAKQIDDFTYGIQKASRKIDDLLGRKYRKNYKGASLRNADDIRFVETGVVPDGADAADFKWLEPLRDEWHVNRESVREMFDMDADGIGKVENYLPRRTSKAGKEALYSAPKNGVVDDLVESGWTKEQAEVLIDDIRSPKNKGKGIDQILNDSIKTNTKRGAKSHTMSRTGLDLPLKWRELQIEKMFDGYYDDIASNFAAKNTIGIDGSKLAKSLEGAVNNGGMPNSIRENIVNSLFRPGANSSKATDVVLSGMANLSLRNAAVTGTISEFASQAARTGGVNQVMAIVEELRDLITGKAKGIPTARGATSGMAAMEGAVGSDIITKNNPFLVAFRKMQSFTDRVNIRASERHFTKLAKKHATKAMNSAEISRVKGLFGEAAYDDLFMDGITRPELLGNAGEIKRIGMAGNLVNTKPLAPTASPLLWHATPLARIATQFKSFMYPTSRSFLIAMTKGTPVQRMGSALSLVTWGTAVGLTIDKAKGLLDRVMRGEDPTDEDMDFTSMTLGALAQSLDKSGSISILSDQIRSAKYAKSPQELMGRTLAGPAGGAMSMIVLSPLMDMAKGELNGRKYLKDVMKSTSIGRDMWIRFGENDREKTARHGYMKANNKKQSESFNFLFDNIKVPGEKNKVDPNINSDGLGSQIEGNAAGPAIASESDGVKREKPKKGREQCGAAVNDWLNLPDTERMGDSLASKRDGKNYSEGGDPIVGGYFVENTGTKHGHVGLIVGKNEDGVFVTDSNRDNKGGFRENHFIAYDSPEYKNYLGFGRA